MQSFPALYRAKVTRVVNATTVWAVIPQVFGETVVTITNFLGNTPPSRAGMGWVSFQGGNPDFPIWMGAVASTSAGGEPGPPGPTGATGATGATGPAGADGADGVGVPAGGTTGQILAKASAVDYATGWFDPSSGGGGITQAEADLRYVNIDGDTMTGSLTLPAASPTLDNQAARKKYVDDQDAATLFSANAFANTNFVELAGDTMTGPINMGGHVISNLSDPGGALHAVNLGYADARYLRVSGANAMAASINMGGFGITNLGDPTGDAMAVTRSYADTRYVNTVGDTMSGGLVVNGNVDVNGTFESNAATVTQLTTTSAGIVCAGNVIAASGYTQNGSDPDTGAGIQNTSSGKVNSAVAAGGGTMINLRRGGAPAAGEIYIRFLSGAYPGVEAGTITKQAGQTILVANGSDYRLKNDLGPVEDALSKVLDLRPIRFTWKSEPEAGEFDGFIAHELAEVVPVAVVGEKDAVDEDGNIQAQGVDVSKLIPLLTAAVQELAHRVEELSQ